ncbi:putative signal transduction protein [Caenispirillum salinarum AK4]|uniref:Putative signal transduction protein n=1 Tax=Caenispirillum salinarum AK4 TaxID=1238182 RepID=K9HUE8_9PROT|nr:diguanylate cyclase [Caenispirillum salinarum]EKV31876.1 putative signal transduction protein [Caenispirillum salinarum AK4]
MAHRKEHVNDPWDVFGGLISRIAEDRRYWMIPLMLWTAMVGSSLWWGWRTAELHTENMALGQAKYIEGMVEAVRSWNAFHGGVYVPIGPETQPNPYLKDPHREIEGPGNMVLTKVNPAFMTRQLADLIRDRSDTTIHLTSLKPINPGNFADAWEAEALKAFEQGSTSRFELVEGLTPLFRYIKPLMVEQVCMTCHEHQGYKVGDIRGGLSVSFTPTELLTAEKQTKQQALAVHLAVWFLVTATTIAGLARVRQQILSLRSAKEHQDVLVEQRTGELRVQYAERKNAEERLRLLIDSSGQGILAINRHGVCTDCNPMARQLLGYDREALVGAHVRDLIYYATPDGQPRDVRTCSMTRAFRNGEAVQETDTVFWTAEGHTLPVEFNAHPLASGEQGTVLLFTDIRERKQAELQLRTLSTAVERGPAPVTIFGDDGVIQYANPPFCDLMGYPADKLVGATMASMRSGQTEPSVYEDLWRTIRRGRVWRGEVSSKCHDGRVVLLHTSVAPISSTGSSDFVYVALFEDITERRREEDDVWCQANFDALTGLPNRNLFQDRLVQAVEQSRRNKGMMALMYIDLDGFKKVNDTLGHAAGDMVLKEAGDRIAAYLRSTDTVARLGGDEFAVLIPASVSPREIEFVAERILVSLAQPFDLGGQTEKIAGSVGIAFYSGEEENLDRLVHRADIAMYAAKRHGGSVFRLYDPKMEAVSA